MGLAAQVRAQDAAGLRRQAAAVQMPYKSRFSRYACVFLSLRLKQRDDAFALGGLVQAPACQCVQGSFCPRGLQAHMAENSLVSVEQVKQENINRRSV